MPGSSEDLTKCAFIKAVLKFEATVSGAIIEAVKDISSTDKEAVKNISITNKETKKGSKDTDLINKELINK